MTDAEAIELRAQLHQRGFDTLGFVRFAGGARVRIAATGDGRVFSASKSEKFGWSRWHRVNTHSFDRFVRHMRGVM